MKVTHCARCGDKLDEPVEPLECDGHYETVYCEGCWADFIDESQTRAVLYFQPYGTSMFSLKRS